MKSYVKVALLGLLAISLFASCDKPNETSENGGGSTKKNYTETAFGMNLEMVYVKGGTFELGATEEQDEVGNEVDYFEFQKPVHKVTLDNFYIGKYEVTQAQWEAVMGTTLKEQRDKAYPEGKLWGEGAEYPMYYVTWTEAQEFCKRLSESTGKKYVLPTEAQWECAARGGNKSQHYKYAGSNDIEEVAWYVENSEKEIHPVGTKKANELGLYDMCGNVFECCSDWFEYEEDDPEYTQPITYRRGVMRGGCFCHVAIGCMVSVRASVPVNLISDYCPGFRVACISK